MKQYSSTTVKLFSDNCPAALGFHEAGAPMFRDIFHPGVAAHAVLQTVGEKKATTPEQQKAVGDAVALELIAKGRSYRGVPEPPLPAADVYEGRDLAIEWLQYNALPENATYELEYSAESLGLNYVGLIDSIYTETVGDEDFACEALVVRDYKTSWQAKANELETLQRRGQAVIARANLPDGINCIVQEVVNLRLGVTYRNEIMLDDEGEALLKLWASDIEKMLAAMETAREPRAGLNCIGCPYFMGCDKGKELIDQVDNKAKQWAGCKAMVQALEPILKKQAKESLIDDGDGNLLGFKETKRRQLNADAIEQLCGSWYPGGKVTDGAVGLVSAMKPGIAQVENVAKVLFQGKEARADRDEFVSLCVDDVITPVFGVVK